MVLTCTLCSFQCNLRLYLIKHLFSTHSTEPTFHFVCGIRGCLHSFKVGSTYSSFKSHASRKHSNWQECVNDEAVDQSRLMPLASSDENCQAIPTERPLLTASQEYVLVETAHTLCTLPPFTTSPLSCPPAERAAPLFLLTFQEKYKLSQSAINFAVGSINTMIDCVCGSMQTSLQDTLAIGDTTTMTACFDERESPFVHLETE